MEFIKKFIFDSNIYIFENIICDIRKDNITLVTDLNTSAIGYLNNHDYHNAEVTFNMIKYGDSEWITIDQVQIFMRNIGFFIQKNEIKHLIEEAGREIIESNNHIKLQNFALFVKQIMEHDTTDDFIKTAFNVFDRCGKGFITSTDILNVLKKMAISTNILDVQEMISDTNGNNSGIITLDEFVRCLDD